MDINDTLRVYQAFLAAVGSPETASRLTLAHALMSRQQAALAAPGKAALTVTQAAQQLGVAPGTIYDLCATGQVRHHRIGKGRGTIRIKPADLDHVKRSSRPARGRTTLDDLRKL